MKKYFLAGLILMGLVFAAPALAQTLTIEDLVRQIAVLQAQLDALRGIATPACYTFTRDLTVGSEGEDVGQLVLFLNGKGYLSGKTNQFDEEVAAALVKYQAAVGINPTGYFGPITRAHQNALPCTATTTPVPTDKPDLDIVGYDFSPTNPKVGDSVTLTTTVKNQGGAIPAGTWLGLGYYFNGQTKNVWSGNSKGLAAGQYATLTTTWTPDVAGTIKVEVAADDGKQITEGNEDNNLVFYDVNVSAASSVTTVTTPTPPASIQDKSDLIIAGYDFSPTNPKVGDSVTLTTTIRNQGGPISAGTWIGLGYWFNGQTKNVGAGLSKGLATGEYATLTSTWVPDTAGTIKVEVAVDDDKQIVEGNENNNQVSYNVAVTAAPASHLLRLQTVPSGSSCPSGFSSITWIKDVPSGTLWSLCAQYGTDATALEDITLSSPSPATWTYDQYLCPSGYGKVAVVYAQDKAGASALCVKRGTPKFKSIDFAPASGACPSGETAIGTVNPIGEANWKLCVLRDASAQAPRTGWLAGVGEAFKNLFR